MRLCGKSSFFSFLPPAGRARPPAARTAPPVPPRDRPPPALRVEQGYLSPGVFALASTARDRLVGLLDRPQRLELRLAVQADILVNRHLVPTFQLDSNPIIGAGQ